MKTKYIKPNIEIVKVSTQCDVLTNNLMMGSIYQYGKNKSEETIQAGGADIAPVTENVDGVDYIFIDAKGNNMWEDEE